jgi:hypothetical protein
MSPANAATAEPMANTSKPAAITGLRPKRSEAMP